MKIDILELNKIACLFFAASYVSEPTYQNYIRCVEKGDRKSALYYRTRSVLIFDRVLNGEVELKESGNV